MPELSPKQLSEVFFPEVGSSPPWPTASVVIMVVGEYLELSIRKSMHMGGLLLAYGQWDYMFIYYFYFYNLIIFLG